MSLTGCFSFFDSQVDTANPAVSQSVSTNSTKGTGSTLPSMLSYQGNIKQPTLDLGLPTATPLPPKPSATPTPLKLPTFTVSPTPTRTFTPIPPSVSLAYSEKFDIGKSVEGRPITVSRLGNAETPIIVIGGGIHGNEPNTSYMVDALDNYFYEQRSTLPPINLYFISRINPDGLQRGDRYNANKVNLNRNFKTSNWQPDVLESANGEKRKNGGGTSPFSEPETAALSRWLLELRASSQHPVVVIFYHAAFPPTGYVQPAYQMMYKGHESDPRSASVAHLFERAFGYRYYSLWPEYTITGEAINWCGDQQLVCIDIEFPDFKNPTPALVQSHARVILDIARKKFD